MSGNSPGAACGKLLLLLCSCAISASCSRLLSLCPSGGSNGGRGEEHHGSSAEYSAICVVARDENKYVREWAEYHRCLGINKVYLYDHNSRLPMRGEVQDLVDEGFVTYFDNISGLAHTKYKEGYSSNLDRFMTTIHGQVFKDCLERFSHRHQWIGFIDVGEFVVFHDPHIQRINCFLKGYEAYGGVSLYWVLLGLGGHEESPAGRVIDSYTSCTPLHSFGNTQFKSFVNTAYKPTMYSPHRATFEPNSTYLVNELQQRIPSGRNKNSTHVYASVYHYATRSKQDFLDKLRRGGGAGVTRPPAYVERLDRRCKEVCSSAQDTYHRLACSQPGQQWQQGPCSC